MLACLVRVCLEVCAACVLEAQLHSELLTGQLPVLPAVPVKSGPVAGLAFWPP